MIDDRSIDQVPLVTGVEPMNISVKSSPVPESCMSFSMNTKTVTVSGSAKPPTDVGKVFVGDGRFVVMVGSAGGVVSSVNVTSVPGGETLLELSVAFALIT